MCMLVDIVLCLPDDRMVVPLTIFLNKIAELIQTRVCMADNIVDRFSFLDQLDADIGGRKRKLRFYDAIQHRKLDNRRNQADDEILCRAELFL